MNRLSDEAIETLTDTYWNTYLTVAENVRVIYLYLMSVNEAVERAIKENCIRLVLTDSIILTVPKSSPVSDKWVVE